MVSNMIGISSQLRKSFIFVSIISIAFITIISNVSINFFFSDYIRETRSKNDLKIVQYIEQLNNENDGLDSYSLMIITHYTYSEAVTVRIKDLQDKIVWYSGTPDTMHMMGSSEKYNQDLVFKGYPFSYKGNKIGTIEVGRPKSIISSFEDKQFLRTINISFIGAFLFSLIIAVLSSMHIAKKFLRPIFLIKGNAKLIENAKYKELNLVKTNTLELHDLSVSVKELAEKLEYQDALRKRLTSDIAHELRTPLAILQSHIEAFIDGVWETSSEKLSIVHNEISRLTKLIKDLSDLSFIESDEIKLYKKEIDISILLNTVVESFEPLFINKNIHLKKEIQRGVLLTGDRDRLSQAFINIISNAYKYTNEKGYVLVSLKQLKDTIWVTIEDSGIGIPKENLKHVFERFYRSDISRSRGTGGAGIGLTIAKVLIEAHGGKIQIDSKEGKGTKVMIEFFKSP